MKETSSVRSRFPTDSDHLTGLPGPEPASQGRPPVVTIGEAGT